MEKKKAKVSKWFLMMIFILSLGIIGVMAGGYYLYSSNVVTSVPDDVAISSDEKSVAVKKSFEKPSPFTYMPIEPKNGKLSAVIELGADGFNYFVIEFDKEERWKKIRYNWNLSLLYEGNVNPEEVLKKITQAIADIQAETKAKDIHFLVSSGALNLPITQEIIQVVESRYVVEKISDSREGMYAFYASVPEKFRENSFLVDIGSGNTKIAWVNDTGKLTTLTTYGAKYYKHGYGNAEVYDSVKVNAADIPKNRREHCFIIGGAPFKMAKKTRKNEEDRYTVLYYPDDYLENAQLYDLELDEKVDAGLNIYRAIFDATQTKQFIFDWNSNFTIGYLLKRG